MAVFLGGYLSEPMECFLVCRSFVRVLTWKRFDEEFKRMKPRGLWFPPKAMVW